MTQGVGDVTLTMAAAAVPVPAQANEGEGQHATCFASTQAPPGLEAVVKSDDPADNRIRADDPTASSSSAALASNGQGDVQPTSLACYRAAMRPLQQDVRNSIATATETILNWLSMLANSIQEHKATPTYQEHARKCLNFPRLA